MPTLNINNETTITNVAGISLTATPVVSPRIGVVTIAGQKGDKGDQGIPGPAGSGLGSNGGVTGLNGLTGAVNIIGDGGISISLSGNNVMVSGGASSSSVDHGDGINLSGNLQLTGQQAWNAANNNGLNLSGNLFSTGATLIARDLDTSGELDRRLVATGSNAWNNALNLSGNINSSGRRAWDDATNLSGNLFSTGNLAILRANSIGTNLSGNLTTTGQTLLTAIANTGQNAVNYTDVRVAATGQANVNYTDTRIAATGLANVNYTDTRVAATGLANVNYTDTRVAATGQSAWIASQNNALNLSGNLTLTGQTAQNNALNLSGSLFSTGSTLIARDLATSGELDRRLVSTGGNAWNNALNLSGSLNASGRRAWDDSTNLSGNLFSTGNLAILNANSIGINLSGRLVATGGLLSAVQVTGSSVIQNVNLSGLGGTLVIQSGSYVLISGAGGISSAANNGDGINLSGNLTLTGQTAQNNALNLSGSLFTTGSTLIARDIATSGELDRRLVATGSNAWNNALNLSGRLVATGGLLSAVQVTGSSLIQNVNLTGFGGTIVTYSGGYVIISGIVQPAINYGDGINLSGQLTLTGQTAQNNALNLSGSLFTTGSTLIARDLATSGELDRRLVATGSNAWNNALNLSGNLFTTGANLSAVKVTGSSIIQVANLTGMGGALVTYSGSYVIISGIVQPAINYGDGINLSGQLTLTGQTAQNNAINLSGNLNASGRRAWDDATNLSGNLFSTGNLAILNANGIGLNLSGRLVATGALLSAVIVTGSPLIQNVNLTGMGGTIVLLSGGYVIVSGTTPSLAGVDHGDGINLSGNLTLTGQTAQNNALNLSGNLNSSGRRAWDDATNLSGNLFSTGNLAILNANGIGLNLSGRLVATGALLSAVQVTGSSLVQNVNLTGLGGTLVLLSGGYVLISGAAGGGPGGGVTSVDGQAGAVIVTGTGALSTFVIGGQIYISGTAGTGAGVNTLNGLQNAVNIRGTGNFNAVTVGQDIYISGSALTNDRQVLFDKGGFTSGENRFQWNYLTGTLSLGVSGVSLPDNPLSVAGSGDTYIQINIQNRSSGKFAQADYILTADIGTDTSYFVDLGINNSGFSHPNYELYKPLDGFLYNRGGDMFLGTAQPGENVYIHAGGIKSGNLISTFDISGLLMETGRNIRFLNNDVALQPRTIAKRQNLAIIQSGLDSMALQPALWNRTFTAAVPATTTSQTLFGNTAVNVGTLSTVRDQILGKHTNVVSAAGQGSAAGLGFTTPDFLRGTITGAGNGFFFTCRFALSDGINATGAYLQPSGSRIFVGLTDQTSTTATALNNPAGNRAGLSVLYASGGAAANVFDTNWAWSVRDNTTELRQSMGWAFQTGAYRFSMYCPPFQAGLATSGIWYQLDDLIRGSGMTGIMTGYLPVGTTALGPVASITTISGGARNIKINSIYCEEARGG